MADIKPNVKILGEENSVIATEKEQTEVIELTKEEQKNTIRLHEEDFIQGLIDADGYTDDDVKHIEIVRNGKVFYEFDIRPLTEEEYDQCKKKHTKYVRNKQFGMKLPEETNNVKYRAALIYTATVDADRIKLWDNKIVWEALRNKGRQILSALDVIECCMKAGEKDRVLDLIDTISGYEANLEEVAKN